MSTARSWPAWVPQLLSLLLAALIFAAVLLPLTRAVASEQAPRRPAGLVGLADVAVAAADLPAGWRVLAAGARTPWPSEGTAQAVWAVSFTAADGWRGSERVLVFPSGGAAMRWVAAARERAAARGAQPSPCRYQAGAATSTTVRTTAGGAHVEQVLLRRGALVLRLTFRRPLSGPILRPEGRAGGGGTVRRHRRERTVSQGLHPCSADGGSAPLTGGLPGAT